MADVIEEVQASTQHIEIPAEIKAQMDIALAPNFEVAKQVEQAQESVVSHETVVEETPFTFDRFKTDFGYEKPDDVFNEIKEFRELKAKPTVATPAEIAFENETSKKLFEALKAGKSDEVYSFLDEQRKLDKLTSSEVTKDNAAEIVKLGMQLKNKELTSYEIDRLFNRKFQLPEKPVFDEIGEDESDYKLRLDRWQNQVDEVNMDIGIEAKMLKPDLEAAKSKLVLPNIEEANNPDYQNYLEFIKEEEEAAKLDAETKEAYRSFTPEQIKVKLPFNDEANKIAFDFEYVPKAEDFAQSIEMVTNPEKYYSSFKNSDGSPNRQKFLEAMHFGLNKDKIILEAINQGKNAAIKANLPDNSGQSNQRQISQTPEMSELDKMMQAAGVLR